jgi:hypothetical protein
MPTGGPEGTLAGVARWRGPGQLARPTRIAGPGSRPGSHGRQARTMRDGQRAPETTAVATPAAAKGEDVVSIKMKLLAAAATLSILGGVSASANAATPQCGLLCGSVFSRELGSYTQPGPVEAVLGGVARVGQPVILKPASGSDPSQDIIPHGQPVSEFYAAGMVSADVNSHYGSLLGVQQEYAPFGIGTELCVGLAKVAYQNEGLTLQPCDVSPRTVWIIDTPDSHVPLYFAIVNASTRKFDRPFAMDLRRDEVVNDRKTLQIHVRRLKFLTNAKILPDSQLWGFIQGVLN